MNKKNEIIDKIMREENIEYFGMIDYDLVRPYLLKKHRSIKLIPDNAKSIISMIFPYKVKINNKNLSIYACVKDYHIVVKKILNNICEKLKNWFNGNAFVPFVDSSPIPEVYVAAICGLGVVGDNNLLINPKYGSFVFIAEIVTDLNLSSTNILEKPRTCLHCGKCKEACPGSALRETFNIDRCSSHISQKKGPLSDEELYIMKRSKSIWGCDICQEVCPLNEGSEYTKIEEFRNSIVNIINFDNYNELDDRAYLWRPKSIVRNMELLKE